MPTIPIYTDKENIQIPERGVTALANAGRRLGQLGNEAAAQIEKGGRAVEQGLNPVKEAANKYDVQHTQLEGQQDIIGVSSVAASLQNNLAQQWQKVSSSGNPEDAQKFLTEVVQPSLDDLQGAAQTPAGRRYAAEQAASLNMHWGDRVNVGQSEMAGAAVVQHLGQVHDQLGASVQVDASHLPQALDQLTQTYNAAAATAGSASVAAHVRDTMLPAAQRDMIMVGGKTIADTAAKAGQDPIAATEAYNKAYGSKLGADGMERLDAYARQRLEIAKHDKIISDNNAALVAQGRSDEAVPQLFNETLGGLQAGTHVLPGDVLNQVNHSTVLTQDTKNAYNTAATAIATGRTATTTNPDTLDNAITGRLVPTGQNGAVTPTTLLHGVANGAISPGDANFLMSADPAMLAHVNSAMQYGRSYFQPNDPTTGKADPVKSMQYQQYQKWVMEHARQGNLPELSQLQTMVPAFKGYTVKAGAQGPEPQWGTPTTFGNATRTIGSFFSGGK